ncbi:MAG: hypothetical protein CVU84_12270 [Firmicutes bacterium HGW-Firmicutes-1]|nr:MAG: hypothetical protein CVU84_12270 [Firmicutes bacterium HGW-Firmicutes-1]
MGDVINHMSKFFFVVIVILTLIVIIEEPSDKIVTALEPHLDKGCKVIDYEIIDTNLYAILGDGQDAIYGKTIAIYQIRDVDQKIQLIKIYENDFSKMKPWKIDCTDLEGDGEIEIVIGVHKKTHYDQNEGNRMFIFNWDGKKLYKKWTGSKLGNELLQFEFIELLNRQGDELIVIDLEEGGKERILVYYWFDFGFSLLAESKGYDDLYDVKPMGTNLLEITYNHKGIKNKKIGSIIKGKMVDTTD